MILKVSPASGEYEIVLERGCLSRASELLQLDRRVLVVTDSGVPEAYAQAIASQCAHPEFVCVPEGECSKSMETLQFLLRRMLACGFTRGDCVAAVGGGVVGDLAGFAASVYMRGIDFYNIPTTVLSQVDSSVGGKTAVNLDGVKNIVGAFHQPKKVLIDPDTLKTLPPRQIANGLAEAVKMALTSDEALFRLFESEDPIGQIDEIIARALRIKAEVVRCDETEKGLRKILNFGHTIGHAIESFEGLHALFHGECVALGMLPMCGDNVRERLIRVLRKLGLPTAITLDADKVMQAMLHDKKMGADGSVTAVFVPQVGRYELRSVSPNELRDALDLIPKEAAL